jgi:radical SAM protein with 4Fe4S-binding SPASM domain
MDEMIRYLQNEVGVDAVRMQHLWFTDKEHADAHRKVLKELFGTDETGAYSHIISTQEQDYIEKLAEEIKLIEKTKYKKPVFIHPKLTSAQIAEYYKNLSFVKTNRCLVAWNSIIVRANGDVMFCPDGWMDDFKLGNVRSSKIDEMWHGEKARKFREELYKCGLFPACARCCAVNG